MLLPADWSLWRAARAGLPRAGGGPVSRPAAAGLRCVAAKTKGRSAPARRRPTARGLNLADSKWEQVPSSANARLGAYAALQALLADPPYPEVLRKDSNPWAIRQLEAPQPSQRQGAN